MGNILQEQDTMSRYGAWAKSKIGFAPFMPKYALDHKYGGTAALGVNFCTLALARTGYETFELLVQDEKHLFPGAHHFIKSHVSHDTFKILNNQGSDFFAGAFYTQTVGSTIAEALRIGAYLVAPQSGITKMIDEHYRFVRSAIGFTLLLGYEMHQAGWNMAKLDVNDVAAYAAGIVTLCHGPQILDGIEHAFDAAKGALFGKPTQTANLPKPNIPA